MADDEDHPNKMRKGLHIAHLNVRSLTGGRKFDMLKSQIDDSGIDVFSPSETWLNEGIPDKFIECSNYNTVCLDRGWKDEERGDQLKKRRRGGLLY